MSRNEHYSAAEQLLAHVKDVHPSMVSAYLAEAHIHALLAQIPDEPSPIPAQQSRTHEWLETSR